MPSERAACTLLPRGLRERLADRRALDRVERLPRERQRPLEPRRAPAAGVAKRRWRVLQRVSRSRRTPRAQASAFLSSRTLPGQGCARSSVERRVGRRARSGRPRSARGCATSTGRSSSRSRSGGTRTTATREAEVEVLAEAAGRDLGAQVAVGRGDDAHVDLPIDLAADAAHRAALEHAQEARLQVERQLADLVEEERAAVRAARTRPRASARAPVKAPRSCPKSSLSTRFAGTEPQSNTTNGPSARGARRRERRAPGRPCRCRSRP